MSLDYYNSQEKHWVSPRLVMLYCSELRSLYGDLVDTESVFQKAREAYVAALVAFAVHAGSPDKDHIMIQVPKAVNQSPDIVTMYRKEVSGKPVQLFLQDLEIVEYNDYSGLDIADFIIEKKLDPHSSKKAYDDKTIIVCHIRKSIRISPSAIHNKIALLRPQATVCLIGGTMNPLGLHRFTRVWPYLDSQVDFDVFEEARNYPKPDSLKLTLGAERKIVNQKTTSPLPSMYEVFELDEDKLKRAC